MRILASVSTFLSAYNPFNSLFVSQSTDQNKEESVNQSLLEKNEQDKKEQAPTQVAPTLKTQNTNGSERTFISWFSKNIWGSTQTTEPAVNNNNASPAPSVPAQKQESPPPSSASPRSSSSARNTSPVPSGTGSSTSSTSKSILKVSVSPQIGPQLSGLSNKELRSLTKEHKSRNTVIPKIRETSGSNTPPRLGWGEPEVRFFYENKGQAPELVISSPNPKTVFEDLKPSKSKNEAHADPRKTTNHPAVKTPSEEALEKVQQPVKEESVFATLAQQFTGAQGGVQNTAKAISEFSASASQGAVSKVQGLTSFFEGIITSEKALSPTGIEDRLGSPSDHSPAGPSAGINPQAPSGPEDNSKKTGVKNIQEKGVPSSSGSGSSSSSGSSSRYNKEMRPFSREERPMNEYELEKEKEDKIAEQEQSRRENQKQRDALLAPHRALHNQRVDEQQRQLSQGAKLQSADTGEPPRNSSWGNRVSTSTPTGGVPYGHAPGR